MSFNLVRRVNNRVIKRYVAEIRFNRFHADQTAAWWPRWERREARLITAIRRLRAQKHWN